MKSISVLAPAKINLGLEIVKKRSDGYHEVDMVMQTVNLCDELCLNITNTGELKVLLNKQLDCSMEDNTVYKAVMEFFRCSNANFTGLEISILKNIPHQAGLAGGSSDAAATLYALNMMFENILENKHLMDIALKIGSDVPFCLAGGAAHATGRGEKLSFLPSMPKCYLVIVKPNISVSTSNAYKLFDSLECTKNHDLNKLIDAFNRNDLTDISSNLFNRFETLIDSDEIFNLKSKMNSSGAMGSLMTGSGSAVYGIFNNSLSASDCAKNLKKEYSQVFVCSTVPHGPYAGGNG